MDHKLFGLLSGAQVTAIALAAIITPGIVTAAITYSNVAVVNPNTGAAALIDPSGSLHTSDVFAQFRNDPYFHVRIAGIGTGDNAQHNIYTVPAGRMLILESVNMDFWQGYSGADNYFWLMDNHGDFLGGFEDTNAFGSHSADFGSGYYLRAGENLQYQSYDYAGHSPAMMTAYTITGFLVPAGFAPPASQDIHLNPTSAKR